MYKYTYDTEGIGKTYYRLNNFKPPNNSQYISKDTCLMKYDDIFKLYDTVNDSFYYEGLYEGKSMEVCIFQNNNQILFYN